MGRKSALAAFLLGVALASPAVAATAKATLKDASGKAVGSADVHRYAERGCSSRLILAGVPAGEHGFHIHAVGKCEAPDFKSAGPHFNPANAKHGLMNPAGSHAGDMPNLYVPADGKLEIEVLNPKATLTRRCLTPTAPRSSFMPAPTITRPTPPAMPATASPAASSRLSFSSNLAQAPVLAPSLPLTGRVARPKAEPGGALGERGLDDFPHPARRRPTSHEGEVWGPCRASHTPKPGRLLLAVACVMKQAQAWATSRQTMDNAKLTANRPLSPHLQIYRPMLTMMMSIAHRISGTANAIGFLLLAWWLVAIASGPEAYATVEHFFSGLIGRALLFLFSWALIHHMLGGIRHLIWDTGRALDKTSIEVLAWLTIISSTVLTILIWVTGYALRGGS